LEIVCPFGGNDAECVIMLLESDGCARVDISEIQELEKLVFGRALVVNEVGGSQDEPSLLPSLNL
jgi:hypothetical protein